MSISEIAAALTGGQLSTAVVSLFDSAFHVKLHGIELGTREQGDPDTGQPNPLEIRYTQEFEIVVHKTVGQKPLTQCTIPDGLWNISVKYNSLKGTNGDLSEKLKSIRDLTAGPKKFYSALFPGGLCTYIQKKEIVQSKGADDWYHSVELTLIENNPGGV
jgi:hypothetical protein